MEKKMMDAGTTDLEIVRGNYFYRDDLPYLTLYKDLFSFNNRCVSLLSEPEYVNIILSRDGKTIHVRGSKRYDFNAVRWYNVKKGVKKSRKIRSRMLTTLLFNKTKFDYGHKYRLNGEYRADDVPELVFYVDDPQVFVLMEKDGKKWFEERFPADWQGRFGIPVSEVKGHTLNTFEDYKVLDVTLERVTEIKDEGHDAESAERLNELREKYIKGDKKEHG